MTCTSAAGLATGVSWPLLTLRLNDMGFGATLIGLNASAQWLAMLGGSLVAPVVLFRIGRARLLSLCLAVISLSLLVMPAAPSFTAWMALRVLLGMGAGIVLVGGPTWVNQLALDKSRGQTIGVLGFLWSIGFSAGPLLLARVGAQGWRIFLIAAIIVSASTLPLALVRDDEVQSGPTAFFDTSRGAGRWILPAVIPLVLGIIDSANDSLLPLYGIRSGLSGSPAVTTLAILQFGVVVSQIPIGYAADVLNRVALLAALGTLASAVAICMQIAVHHLTLLWIVLWLLGFSLGGIWAVGLIVLGERFSGAELVTSNIIRGVLYGVGGIVSAPLFGAAMESFGASALPGITAILLALLVLGCFADRASMGKQQHIP